MPVQLILNFALLLYIAIALAQSGNIAHAQSSDVERKAVYSLREYVSLRESLIKLLRESRAVQLNVENTYTKENSKGTRANTASPANSDTYSSKFQQKIIEYTNNERAKRNLKPLKADIKLAKIAQKHTADMQANNFFSHTNKSGCDTGCRIDKAKYSWKSYGENLHWMSGYDYGSAEAAEQVVSDWMDSKNHRANILNAKFTNVGVGVVVKGDTVYTTADYSLPK